MWVQGEGWCGGGRWVDIYVCVCFGGEGGVGGLVHVFNKE